MGETPCCEQFTIILIFCFFFSHGALLLNICKVYCLDFFFSNKPKLTPHSNLYFILTFPVLIRVLELYSGVINRLDQIIITKK